MKRQSVILNTEVERPRRLEVIGVVEKREQERRGLKFDRKSLRASHQRSSLRGWEAGKRECCCATAV